MLKTSIMESYFRMKPNLVVYCKNHPKAEKIKIPKTTKWDFQWSVYSKVNFCLT